MIIHYTCDVPTALDRLAEYRMRSAYVPDRFVGRVWSWPTDTFLSKPAVEPANVVDMAPRRRKGAKA